MLTHGALELVAPRSEIRERAGKVAESLFSGRQLRFRSADPLGHGAFPFGRCVGFAPERRVLLIEPVERCLRVGGEPAFARGILAQLNEPSVEFGDALVGARLFAVEGLARDHEPLQRGGGAGLRFAQ